MLFGSVYIQNCGRQGGRHCARTSRHTEALIAIGRGMQGLPDAGKEEQTITHHAGAQSQCTQAKTTMQCRKKESHINKKCDQTEAEIENRGLKTL